MTLEEAVAHHVRPGDAVQVLCGHSRWTAAAREMARQHWGTDAGFTLVMLSLSSLGALFFRGGMVRKVVTTYSGDTFPTYTPNPDLPRGVRVGRRRGRALVDPDLHPTPRGRGARAAGRGDGVAAGLVDGVERRLSPWPTRPSGRSGSWRRSCPTSRWSTVRWPTGTGNVALSEPLLEGLWGAWAARRGVVATVERVVERLDGLGPPREDPRPSGAGRRRSTVRRPSRGPVRAAAPRSSSYGEDIPFWSEARARHPPRLRRLGAALGARARHPRRLPGPAGPRPPGLVVGAYRSRVVAHSTPRPTPSTRSVPPSRWEHAAAYGARELEAVARRARRRRRAGRRRASPTSRRGWPWRGPVPGGVPSGSPPSSACGATPPLRPTPTSSTTACSRARRCSPTHRRCWAWSWGDRARAPSPVSARPRSTGTGT